MLNTIINLKDGAVTESIALLGKSLWYSSRKHENLDAFRRIVEKKDGVFLDYHGIVDYTSIKKIVINEASKNIYLKYTARKKAKIKEIDFSFSSKYQTLKVGDFIGNQTNLTRQQRLENKNTRLLLNFFWIIFSVFTTWFLASFEEPVEVSGSRTSRGAKSLFKLIHDTIGQDGILIVGILITVFLVYKTFKRYKSPSEEIVFS